MLVWACAAKRRWWLGEEMHGVWSRGSQTKRKTKDDLEKDCQACKLNKEDAIDHSTWRNLINDVWWSGCVWVGECFFWYRPTRTTGHYMVQSVFICDAAYVMISSNFPRWCQSVLFAALPKLFILQTQQDGHNVRCRIKIQHRDKQRPSG